MERLLDSELEPIVNCDAAVRAIESIVEQGEGPRGDWRNAHFGRFLRVLDEYLETLAAQPGLEVARPVLPALVRPPESGEDVDLITDPRTARIADLANVAYEVLLQLLYRLLSRIDETDEQMGTLSRVGVGLMFDVIEPLGEILTTLPVGPAREAWTPTPIAGQSAPARWRRRRARRAAATAATPPIRPRSQGGRLA